MGGWIYLGANQGRGTWPQHLESLKTFSDDSPLCRLVTGELHTAPTVFPGLASQRAHAYLYPSLANHVAPLITQNSLTDLQSGHKSQQILSPVASLTQYWIPLAERKRRGGRGRDKKNRHSLWLLSHNHAGAMISGLRPEKHWQLKVHASIMALYVNISNTGRLFDHLKCIRMTQHTFSGFQNTHRQWLKTLTRPYNYDNTAL